MSIDNLNHKTLVDKFTLKCSKCGKTFDITHTQVLMTTNPITIARVSVEFWKMLSKHIKDKRCKLHEMD